MRLLQARCHIGLGRLLRRLGRLDEARAALGRSVEMCQPMGLQHWLPEAERAGSGCDSVSD